MGYVGFRAAISAQADDGLPYGAIGVIFKEKHQRGTESNAADVFSETSFSHASPEGIHSAKRKSSHTASQHESVASGIRSI